jgi:hypothetical protein
MISSDYKCCNFVREVTDCRPSIYFLEYFAMSFRTLKPTIIYSSYWGCFVSQQKAGMQTTGIIKKKNRKQISVGFEGLTVTTRLHSIISQKVDIS